MLRCFSFSSIQNRKKKIRARASRGSRVRRLELQHLEARLVMATLPIISEVLAANSGGLNDSDGESSDWIEIYNPTSQPINLDGWFLTDDLADLNSWRFPSVNLPANDFLTVFASGKNRAVAGSELHTNFRLSTSGDFLALVKPDSTIAYQFSPNFPAQVSNVSYGATFQTSQLIQDGSPIKVRVPSDGALGQSWTQPGFNDAGWTTGAYPAGFGVTQPGFEVQYVKANLPVDSIATARTILATPSMQSFTVQTTTPYVNYLGNGGGANFLNDFPFPTQNIGDDYDDFLIRATSLIDIPTTGNWTFAVNSDDGFSLVLEKDSATFSSEFAGQRAPADTYATFNIPSAGRWRATLIMFERGGGASVEMFAAPGSHSAFNNTFRLVGDSANGGLAANFGIPVGTDLSLSMLGKNSTVFLRSSFSVTSTSSIESLVLKMRYDDGFVAYLNGNEVVRRNAPLTLPYNAAAPIDRTPAQVSVTETISLTDFIPLLQVGTNVLAIHGLNSSASDDSFLIQPQLYSIAVDSTNPRYFATPTPNAPNGTPYLGIVNQVTASVAGGFFTSSFTVTLGTTSPGATIRYTVDGSTPTESNGLLYSSPIVVSNTTTLRAIAYRSLYVSMPTISRTYLFLDDVIAQSANGSPPAGWPSTWGNNVVDYGMDPDIIALEGATAVKNALRAIPTLAISTDIGNLFDPNTGIYGNAYGDGREWERPAAFELLNPDGSAGFQVNAGLRIRGGYSRSSDNPKHSFRLFFRGEYGDGSLDYPLFGTEGVNSFKKIDLRTAQNYSWSFGGDPNNTFIADVFARESQRDLGEPYTRSRWYHLYINGQYWGLYQTQERAEAENAANYFGGTAADYDVLKPEAGPYVVIATDGNDAAYRRLWEAAVNGFASQADYLRVQGKNPDGTENLNYEVLLDVDNLIIYMMNIFYGGNLDAPISAFLGNNAVNNFFAVRDRTGRDGFRFFLHDSEHTLLPWGLNENRNGPFPAGVEFRHFNPQWLHQRLMANPEYRIRFADLVQKAFFGVGDMTVPAAQARYQNHINQLESAIRAESARWGDSKRPNDPLDRSDWLNAVGVVRDFYLTQRGSIVLNQWRANGLFPSIASPTFLVNGAPSNGGQVTPGSRLRFAAPSGLVYYTVDGTDPRLPGGGIHPNALVYDPSAITNNLVTRDSSWRYLDTGLNLGTAWKEPTYAETGWKTGNAELGYGDGDEATVVGFGPNANNKYITTYFRKAFQVADPTSITLLTLRLKRDDGAVVYINGTEAVRNNLPSGTITSSTLALNAIGGADEATFYDFEINPALLVSGNNVIAVEIHQSAANSSDISFDAELVASQQSNPGIIINSSLNIIARAKTANEWSAANAAAFLTAVPATSDNLTITEVMYNPPLPSGDEPNIDRDEYEFVEFRNIGPQPVSLQGVRFSAGITFDFADGIIPFINPGQTIVVARNLTAFRARYGDGPLVAGTWGATTTNFSNGGELVTLLGPGDAVIDSFTYDDISPWPTSADGGGYSLTVRWVTGDYNAANNWRASYLAKGTPGYEENDYPENLNLSNNVVAEALANAVVGNLSALDPNANDQANLLYTIQPGNDGTLFQIVGNQLRVGPVGLDFESATTRSVKVRASDPGGLFVERTFTVQVTNVNESPTALQLTPSALFENLQADSLIGTLVASDPDANDSFAYELVTGVGDSDNSQFRISGSSLHAMTSFDFETKPTYSIRVRVTDGGGLTFERPLNVQVVNLPELIGIQIGDGNIQRSLVSALSVTFDGIVDLVAGAFVVTKRSPDPGNVPTSFTTNINPQGQTVALVSFSGPLTRGAANGLVDGNYQLQIDSSKVTSNGFAYDGDRNGIPGGDTLFGTVAADRFYALYGDVTGDRLVATAEFNSFRAAFGKSSSDQAYIRAFDYETNDIIGTSDFNEFRRRFGKSLGFS